MKLLKRVSRLEPKRAFVMAQRIRKFGRSKRYMPRLTRKQYLVRLQAAKRWVRTLREPQLDKIISKEWSKRLDAYNESIWYRGRVSVKEVGVWSGAGGLPPSWTHGSLSQTAEKVKGALIKNSKRVRARSKRAIPRIIEFEDIILHEPYLFPIIFKSGTGTNGRKKMKRLKGDIDDGCMRSIALTIGGAKRLSAYIGFPRSNKKRL